MSQKYIEYVVARYNESINWVESDYTTIYNKGLSGIPHEVLLPNVGREAHTYLYHIVTNYDNLAEITIFTQGKIDDHGYTSKINTFDTLIVDALKDGISHNYYTINNKNTDNFTRYFVPEFNIIHKEMLISKYGIDKKDVDKITFKDWFESYIDYKYPNPINIYQYAIFAVRKDKILSREKAYYEKLLSQLMHVNSPIEAHFLERSWHSIFIH